MKIIALSGCPAALPTLKYLFSKKYLSAILCPEETPASETISLESWADYHELPCWQVPQRQLEKEITELISEIKPDLFIVYGYPHQIDGHWLKGVKYGGWNVHFSLHQAQEASITIHQLEAGGNYGQIVSQCRLALLSSSSSSIDQLSKISVGLLQEAFGHLKKQTNTYTFNLNQQISLSHL